MLFCSPQGFLSIYIHIYIFQSVTLFQAHMTLCDLAVEDWPLALSCGWAVFTGVCNPISEHNWALDWGQRVFWMLDE